MGPEATMDLYMKIVKWFQAEKNAKYDDDFPAFAIESVPIPDVVEKIKNENVILGMISSAAIRLESSKCKFIVIACNSVQYLLPEIQKKVNIPILGIAAVNTKYLIEQGYKRVGILGTETTINKKVYDNELEEAKINLIGPSSKEQAFVTQAIMEQLCGKISTDTKNRLLQVINNLRKQKIEAILLACTELPLILQQRDSDLPLIDCTKIYADETAKLSTLLN